MGVKATFMRLAYDIKLEILLRNMQSKAAGFSL